MTMSNRWSRYVPGSHTVGKLFFGRGRQPLHSHVRKPTFNSRVKKVINRGKEKKIKDTQIGPTSTPVDGTSTIAALNLIAQGDDFDERDGEEIRITKIEMRMHIFNSASAVADTIYRVIVLRANRNVDGVMPSVEAIIETDEVDTHQNRLNRGDYTFLYDKWGILPVATTSGDIHRRILKFSKTFKKPKLATYDVAGATIGAVEKGGLFVILMNDQATNKPTYEANFRVTYVDV